MAPDAAAQETLVFEGSAPKVAGSRATLTLDLEAEGFSWRSDDSVLGTLDLVEPTPDQWHAEGPPSAIVFRSRMEQVLISGTVLLGPENQAIVFVAKENLRVRYVLTRPVCGDGVVNADEECDDGGGVAGDGCAADCTIEAGFVCSGEPSVCTDVDECADGTADCDVNATCTNTPGAFHCTCNEGYFGTGETCEDLDECALGLGDCEGAHVTCVNLSGSFACECLPGFSGDGVTCIDVDECAEGTAGCDAVATCTNTEGSFTCRCPPGFTGDGFTCADIPPTIAITDPPNLSFLNRSPVTVGGTVEDTNLNTVEVNGVAATVDEPTWSTVVPLFQGNNTVTAVAMDTAGNATTATIQLTLDIRPPTVTIESPEEGAVSTVETVTVSGRIDDIVVGTVNGNQARVTVNGVPAQVANRSFVAADVPLTVGANTITATAVDRLGNSASTSVSVTFDPFLAEPRLRMLSGNNQTAPIREQLPEPLAVELVDAAGSPVAGRDVVFKVVENDGTLSHGGATGVRSLVATTDAEGRARASWTLGARAGAANNKVEASAVGFLGRPVFTATALSGAPAKIVVEDGNQQTGATGQPLPHPLVVVVTDEGNNRLAGVPVTFRVTAGGGSLDGRSASTVRTDSDGRAPVILTLGPEEGVDNNLVEADFIDNPNLPVGFVASAKTPGDPAETALRGVVLDNTDLPIEGVTLRIEGKALETQTDAEGQFFLQPVPVGHVVLFVDGSTAQRPGAWPTLQFEINTVAGRENTLGMPIFLLPLDLENGIFVDETTGGVLTLPQVPGFSLTVEPGSVTFPGGGKSGLVSVTVVHADKVPMEPNFGQQPRFIVTIQPSGAQFDPPAPLTIPNVDGLSPGEVTEIYSFDHDLGLFVTVGTGSVSEDGTVIESDPGVGIIEGGWHSGGNPPATGDACGGCGPCQKCEGRECVPDEELDFAPCESACVQGGMGTCYFGECGGGDPIRCDDGNDCTEDSCDERRGCVHEDLSGDICTDECLLLDTGVCLGGICAGQSDLDKVAGSACDDGNPCVESECALVAPAIINCEPVANRPGGTACETDDACTIPGTAVCDGNGACTGQPFVCGECEECRDGECVSLGEAASCESDNPCVELSFCSAEGECLPTIFSPAGTPCDDVVIAATGPGCVENVCDGNGACIQRETCEGCTRCDPETGECVDGCPDCRTCDPSIGLCLADDETDGMSCQPGDACIDPATARCQAGECVGDEIECPDTGNECSISRCEGGECRERTLVGLPCDDGNECTEPDHCSPAVPLVSDEPFCLGIPVTDVKPPKTCDDGDDNICTLGICAPGLGECVQSPLDGDQVCDVLNLNNPCVENCRCVIGDFGIPGCECDNVENGTECFSVDPCIEGKVCMDGECTGGQSKDCSDGIDCTRDSCKVGGFLTPECVHEPDDSLCPVPENPCLEAVCDPGGGGCRTRPANEGSPCEDGDLCTEFDICMSGVCQGISKDCSLLDGTCTEGACNPNTGLCDQQPVNEGGTCNDDQFCTVGDRCVNGECVGGGPRDCSAVADPCNDGRCDEAANLCVKAPKTDGTVCDDGLFCTNPDACTGGVCGGPPRDCSDGVSCTVDSCDEAGGSCVSSPDDAQCDDNSLCTTDSCNPLSGCQNVPIDCSDGNLCTQDLCDPLTGCVFPDVTCSGDQCNSGTCDPLTGDCLLVPANEGSSCDDGDASTVNDVCRQGSCIGLAGGTLLRIDEVVTDPQSDWSDSGGGGAPFDASPGSGSINSGDEFIEIHNVGTTPVRVRDMVVRMTDGSPSEYIIGSGGAAVEVYSTGSDADGLLPGDILVIGNPTGEMDDTVLIEIVFGGTPGLTLADVQLGAGGAPAGTSTDATDEAVGRVTDSDNDSIDFVKGPGSPGVANFPP